MAFRRLVPRGPRRQDTLDTIRRGLIGLSDVLTAQEPIELSPGANHVLAWAHAWNAGAD